MSRPVHEMECLCDDCLAADISSGDQAEADNGIGHDAPGMQMRCRDLAKGLMVVCSERDTAQRRAKESRERAEEDKARREKSERALNLVREALARHDALFSHSETMESVQESRGRFLREVRAVVEL